MIRGGGLNAFMSLFNRWILDSSWPFLETSAFLRLARIWGREWLKMLHKPPRSRPKNKQTIRKSLQRHQPLRGRGTLSEINPLAGNLLLKANTFCHSATKKRRTEEADTDIGYRSPGGKKIGKFVYKTPDEKGDHDASSISSTLSGTGFSKDYPH